MLEAAEREAKRRTGAILRRLFPARIAESFSEGIVMVADIAGFTYLANT